MQAVILAAGASSRFFPFSESRHKALFEIMGKPLIQYTLESLEREGIKEVIIVVSPGCEMEDLDTSLKTRFVVQEKPRGMGNALQQCKKLLDEQFLLLSPYHYNAHELVNVLLEKTRETKAGMVLAAQKTEEPWKYGMLGLKGDKAMEIVEKPGKGEEPSQFKVLSVYLPPREILEYLEKTEEHQYSFEDGLQEYMKDNEVRVVKTEAETISVKYAWDVLEAMDSLQSSFLPDRTSDKARVDETATIEGKVFIGEGVKIFENAVIKGPAFLGKNCVVGNNALIRKGCCLEEGVVIGANTEVKHSYIGGGTHVHSGFIGDSVIGSNCRIGAEFVTANRRMDREEVIAEVKGKKISTGRTFLGGVIGNKTRIGIHVSVMPGIIIGNNSVIGPHTLVGKNVPSHTRYYAKFKGIIEEKMKKRRR